MRPEVGTEAIGGESEIVIQADALTFALGVFLGCGELKVELPLEIFVKQNLAPMFFRELGCGGGFRVLILLRPCAPGPDVRALAVHGVVQRGMHGEAMQQVAFLIDKDAKLLAARATFAAFH